MVDRYATRRVAGWAFILWVILPIPWLIAFALTGRDVGALSAITRLAVVAPAWLYLGRRLTPLGGPWAMRLAVLFVAATALDTAAWIVVVALPSLKWVVDALDIITPAALVPFVWLMAYVARGDPALPWLGALSIAVVAVAIGLPLASLFNPATDDLGLAVALLQFALDALAAYAFVFVWSVVVGRRLLREDRLAAT